MAHNRYLRLSTYQQGGVLIPVLFLASIMTLGVIILLQSHITQKKSMSDFKIYLINRRENQKLNHYIQSLSLDKILKLNNLKLIQKIPNTLHYLNSEWVYYFQTGQFEYIYKFVTNEQDIDNLEPGIVVIKHNAEFDYFGMMISIIKNFESVNSCLYFFDKKTDKVVFKSSFRQEPYLQLVGNPVESIYVHDTVGLYKIVMGAESELVDINLLQPIDPGYHVLPISPVITRDARGDGRMITLTGLNKNFVYHEPSSVHTSYLDLFDHYYFPGK